MQLMEQMKSLLKELKLGGMSEVIEHRLSSARNGEIAPAELLLSLLLDEKNRRDQNRYQKRMSAATLGQDASLELIDWDSPAGLHKTKIKELVTCAFISAKENVIITGESGGGKSYITALIGHHACRQGYSVSYKIASQLFEDLMAARADGSVRAKLRALMVPDLLIIDDWALKPTIATLASDFYDIVSERYEKGSLIVTSQRDFKEWYPYLNDPLIADGCLDRIAHNSHRIEISGEISYRERKEMKKNQTRKAGLKSEEKPGKKLPN